MLGCDAILSASAVGSLKEEYAPRHAVIPDQMIDRTCGRRDSYFGEGVVAHASLADPVCAVLSNALEAAGRKSGLTVHRGGTYVCIDGPHFSTRAESNLYRSWGADVIGMTNLTEARLAREAEICYASLALVTDYDCWRPATREVSVSEILGVLRDNAVAARRTMREAVLAVRAERDCACRDAMRTAILTDPKAIPEEAKERLRPIAGRYLSPERA
jgi:5'-methylthioadenosine phosphorylase